MTAAAVLGGGPSLPKDLEKLPKDCMLISVNDHAFHFCKPHVLVHQDELKWAPAVREVLKTFTGVVVSPLEDSHILLPRGWWDENQSSALATWYALWSDYNPVILCGMDCYQGPVKHCPPSTYHSEMFDFPLDFYTRPWVEDCKNSVPHPERIRAMSGPLVNVFQPYQQG